MKYLLDTNVISELAKPSPNDGVINALKMHRSDCVTCSVVAYELLLGVQALPAGSRKTVLQAFVASVLTGPYAIPALAHDLAAAQWQSVEVARLKVKGLVAPWRDTQIAASAASRGVTLVTRNVKDFQHFKNLFLANWFE